MPGAVSSAAPIDLDLAVNARFAYGSGKIERYGMSFNLFAWLFAAGLTIHNLEEAIFLPAWSRTAARWHAPIGAAEFRFAVVVLTLSAYVCAGLSTAGSMVGTYLLCGYSLAMFLNVFIPHLAATAVMRRYAPGTATAVCCNLPITVLLIRRAVAEHRIALATFAWAGPLTVVMIVLSIPLLFTIGRTLRLEHPA